MRESRTRPCAVVFVERHRRPGNSGGGAATCDARKTPRFDRLRRVSGRDSFRALMGRRDGHMDQQDARFSSDREMMDYVGRMSHELAVISGRKGRPFLAHLLSLAAEQAMAISSVEDQARYEAEVRHHDKAEGCS